ncbi:hypothetical protein BGZ83_002903, partial [Gryganskiella cystojenkinii]
MRPGLKQPSRSTRPLRVPFQILFTRSPLALFFTISFLSLIVLAQNPPANTLFQWALLDEKTLYVQGGGAGGLYALDLTKTFTEIAPPWTNLSSGFKVSSESLVLTADKSQLILWDNNNKLVSRYTIATNKWQNDSTPNGLGPSEASPAMDADTNILYILNGYVSTPNAIPSNNMMTYNATSGTSGLINNVNADMATVMNYGLMWSTVRKSILYYGGTPGKDNGTVYLSIFYEYVTAAGIWNRLTTTGVTPGALSGHCMVQAYGGTKMVVFGGTVSAGVRTGQILLLDLQTLAWTLGNPSNSPREGAACAVAGDSFLAWGGKNGNAAIPNTPIIYNMKTKQWGSQFDPTPPTGPTTPN